MAIRQLCNGPLHNWASGVTEPNLGSKCSQRASDLLCFAEANRIPAACRKSAVSLMVLSPDATTVTVDSAHFGEFGAL